MKNCFRLFHVGVTLIGSVLLLYGCSSLTLNDEDATIGCDLVDFPWAKSEGVRNVLRRAAQLATITWTPLLDVPGNSGVYPAGEVVLGIPYSSTKQIDKYVGLDVSLHTFMTAVHNPRSVLYTENLRNAPYNGSNCACYYGTVCSSAVAYALNLSAPYPSSFFPTLPGFYRVSNQDMESLEPGDVLHRPGHVLMVYRVYRNDAGRVTDLSLFEAASRFARISKMSSESFLDLCMSEQYVAYRYNAIDEVDVYEKSPYVAVGNEHTTTVIYNDSLCPNRGDESVYRRGDPVIINVLDDSYTFAIVKGVEEYEFKYTGEDIVLNNLPPGVYSAYLTDGVKSSGIVSFLIAEPIVKVEDQGLLHISFSCEQGKPSYCVFCDRSGSFKSIHLISDEEIDRGYIDIEPLENSSYFCKVIFNTPFGTVINEPIKVTSI